MKRFLEKMRYVKPRDFLAVFQMLLAVPYAAALKMRRPHIWLICENGKEARDNGYWLYRYICLRQPQTDAVYVLDRRSPDYRKTAALHRQIIEPAGIRHWAYYMAAQYNISSQKDGKPNAAVCYFLEVYGIWKNTRIFLQHGIVHNDVEFLHYENTRMSMFICGARPEYEYVKRHFGYPAGAVRYTGLARFDGLQHFRTEKIILIMPTWRRFIATPAAFARRFDTPEAFVQTRYFKAWEEFFEDPRLKELLQKSGYRIVFYPHRNMQRFLPLFRNKNRYIRFADWRRYDVQNLLKQAAFLITDYSSVAMDFAYMNKPLLYYQFDEDDFRRYQYARSYYDYRRDGFGPVCETYQQVIRELERSLENGFVNTEPYSSRTKKFFELHDGENCRRIYEAIIS